MRKLAAQVAILKIDCPEGAEVLLNRDKAQWSLSLQGAGKILRRRPYRNELRAGSPQLPTRAQLWPKVAQIFFAHFPTGAAR